MTARWLATQKIYCLQIEERQMWIQLMRVEQGKVGDITTLVKYCDRKQLPTPMGREALLAVTKMKAHDTGLTSTVYFAINTYRTWFQAINRYCTIIPFTCQLDRIICLSSRADSINSKFTCYEQRTDLALAAAVIST